jgi:raffinose/stachyose/melibiose transport system permease protein
MRQRGDKLFYLYMVAPAMVLFLLVIAYPIVFSILLGFTEYNFQPNESFGFAGLVQYEKILSDPKFWIGFKNNMIVVAVSVFGQIPLGFALAYLLFRGTVKHTHFFQAMVFLPQAISTVVVGILWRNMFGVRGAATAVGAWITGDPRFRFEWFLNPNTAMAPVAIALLWVYTGFYMLVFLANMQKMNSELIESAQMDGAGEMQIFFRIIVPNMIGVIVVTSILAISGSLKGFDLIFALAPNDGMGVANYNLVLPTYMYHYAFKTSKYAFGSAISNIIVLISVGLIVVSNVVGRRVDPHREVYRGRRRRRR